MDPEKFGKAVGVNRHLKDTLRASATVVGAAAGLMVLGYSVQSTDGFVHTDLTGPLGLFGPGALENETDILAIGNGPSDAAALASLLKVASPNTKAGNTFAASSTPTISQLPPAPLPAPVAAGPVAQQAAPMETTPVVDADGKVDCTGAVSCLLDPRTNITTVTYADGTMAMVQMINGMTLVTYQNVNDKNQPKTQVPSTNTAPLPVAASPAKPVPSPLASVSVPATTDASADPPDVDSVPAVNPGPPATVSPSPPAVATGPSATRPRVTITKPPQDYNPPRPRQPSYNGSSALDTVREALKSVVDAVGKAVNPGASTAVNPGNSTAGNPGNSTGSKRGTNTPG